MKVITKEFITNVLSKDNAACASIQAGETVVFETYDCFTNQFLPEEATFENVVRKPGNPATGPLYVEGAMPGDMLRIEILDIELGPVGIVMLGPNSGSERSEFPKKVLKRVPVKDGKAYYDGKVEIPVEPMIGVIGVAPAGEGVSTITPMDHGGNMDCTQIKRAPCCTFLSLPRAAFCPWVIFMPLWATGKWRTAAWRSKAGLRFASMWFGTSTASHIP